MRISTQISWRRWVVVGLWSLYALLWAGGVGSHLVKGEAPAGAIWAAPAFLTLAGGLTIVDTSWREVLALLVAALIGVVAEIAGVHSGLIFSDYYYTEALGPRVWGVPLVMAPAWMVLVAYVRGMVTAWQRPRWLGVVVGAIWMTAIDLVIDPLAAGQLGYWHWAEPGAYYGIPARNFLGWFAISLTALALIWKRGDSGPSQNTSARKIGGSIILFFTLVALAYRLMLAVAVGVTLWAFHLHLTFTWRRLERSNEKIGNQGHI